MTLCNYTVFDIIKLLIIIKVSEKFWNNRKNLWKHRLPLGKPLVLHSKKLRPNQSEARCLSSQFIEFVFCTELHIYRASCSRKLLSVCPLLIPNTFFSCLLPSHGQLCILPDPLEANEKLLGEYSGETYGFPIAILLLPPLSLSSYHEFDHDARKQDGHLANRQIKTIAKTLPTSRRTSCNMRKYTPICLSNC